MTPPGAWSTAEGAASWQASLAQRQQSLAFVTELLFAQAGIGPGVRALEVGSGTGDAALLAAARVGPAGSVLATDASAPMLEVSARLAREAGFTNVSTRALRAVRTALRPGGRFAASVWGPLERNPFHAAPIAAVRRRRAIPLPPPEVVQAFSLCSRAALADALRAGGFARIRLQSVP